MLVNFKDLEINQLVQPNLRQNKLVKTSYKTKNINLNSMPNAVYNVAFCAKPNITPTKLERFEGCLLGGAIGDAFGAALEFINLDKIKSIYGKNGAKFEQLIDNSAIKEFTDDTQMSCYTADGLIKSAIKNDSILEPDLGCVYQSYRDWLCAQTGRANLKNGWLNSIEEMQAVKYPGNTCITALVSNKPGNKMNPINDSKGNGGIMRVAPVGLMYNEHPELAFDIASGCTLLTHGDPDAYLSAGTFASIIAYLTSGHSLRDSIKMSFDILKKKNNSKDIANSIENAIMYATANASHEDVLFKLGQGKIGSEALSIAIYCGLKYPQNIKKAIETAANITGDSDTVAAITGNLVGANVGIKNIPQNITNVKGNHVLGNLASDLYNVIYSPNTVCKSKYPIKNVAYQLELSDIMGKEQIPLKHVNSILKHNVNNVPTVEINNILEFLIKNDVSQNIAEKISIPLSLIAQEITEKECFNKFIFYLAKNCSLLVENENKRFCWFDERISLEQLLWELYDVTLQNPNYNKWYEIFTIMSESGMYNIKQMLDLLVNNKYSNKEVLNDIIENLYLL